MFHSVLGTINEIIKLSKGPTELTMVSDSFSYVNTITVAIRFLAPEVRIPYHNGIQCTIQIKSRSVVKFTSGRPNFNFLIDF